ncbi:MAG: ATP-dependent sacrificial sulfur transferase LarE [Candidatus Heimdallarchaeota archaeon]|nr:ATP-dependent sacrificial sulfur transferase LarE [Candidatus Heimdallarchaeota archaeon]
MQLTQLELIDEKTIKRKIDHVQLNLSNKKVIIAFSGGVDSSVLAFLAKQFCKKVLLVMQDGHSIGIGEIDYAKNLASILNLDLEFLYYNEYEISENYAENPHNRCYYCKGLLHKELEKLRVAKGFDMVLNGTNASDLQGHRPGYQAVQEKGAITPLVDANLSKLEIRWIAKNNQLPVWDKPASACLASRFETGTRITKEGLQRVAEAEYFIKSNYQVDVLRVRDDGSSARLEVGKDEIWKLEDDQKFGEVKAKLTSLGYHSVVLDKKGYRSALPRTDI